MRLPRRLPQPIRDILRFTLIGAVVGAAYGHMMAIADGRPLVSVGGLPRGVVTGVLIIGILFSFEQALAQPPMARLREMPFLAHLAMKTIIYLVIILFGLAIGARLLPTPAEVGVRLPIPRQDVLFSFVAVLVIRFIADINRLLGQNVLLNFITGYFTGHGWSSACFCSSISRARPRLPSGSANSPSTAWSAASSSTSPRRSWRPTAKSTAMSAM